MDRIKPGTRVAIHYIGTLDNGRIFDSTADDDPLVFTLGDGQVFPALEREVSGMAVGETRNIYIPAADAYGPRLKDNIITLPRSIFPVGKEIRVGQKLGVALGLNTQRIMIVSGVAEATVTLDGNHALAGRDLTFAVRLQGLVEEDN